MIESAAEFAELFDSESVEVRQRAAIVSAEVEVWRAIFNDYPELRKWVVYNKTVPLEVLEVLSKDSDPDVRAAVAMKRKITTDLRWELASDVDSGVRLCVANNAKTEIAVLEFLSNDESPLVRNAATEIIRRRAATLKR